MSGSAAWDLFRAHGVRVGTASWTDKTLLTPDLFYPKEVKTPAERLAFYATNFPIVEVDATYYALPSERNAQAWAERTPDEFVFNVKAFGLLTQHPAKATALPKDLREALPDEVASKARFYPRDVGADVMEACWDRFLGALQPLAKASKLRALLFQFPEWFPPSLQNKDALIDCGDRVSAALPGVACAVEFRNEGWMRDPERQARTLSFLEEHGLPYVCVDMPQGFRTSIPPVAAVTAPLAVVRFHGRKADTWGKRGVGVSERFRYDYSKEELAEWSPRIDRLASDAREVHVLMNNCYQDYAVRSARTMAQLGLDLLER